MLLRKHLVVEITILEVVKTSGWQHGKSML
jgi:hypothetical protein